MKQWRIGYMVLCLVLFSVVGHTSELMRTTDTDYLTPYVELYHLPIQADALENSQLSFTPSTIEIGDITIEFVQIACDGDWILTCALASSDKVLLLPGGATLERPACGEIFVSIEKNDNRSFLELAQDTGLEIRSVYVYLKEFDHYGLYFLDHSIQSDKTILYSGCCLPNTLEESALLNWTVQVYSVNLHTNKLTLMEDKEVPVVVLPKQ